MAGVVDGQLGLRERKKRRTRRALTDAALRLIAEKGYDNTTVADIAAAAEVSPRTFFSYFPSKEDVLLADADERMELIRDVLGRLPAGTPPLAALRQVIDAAFSDSSAMFGNDRHVRVALVLDRPELRAKAMQRLLTAQRQFAGWLTSAYPARLDEVLAMAVSGALLGALTGAAVASFDRADPPERTRTELERALTILQPALAALDRG